MHGRYSSRPTLAEAYRQEKASLPTQSRKSAFAHIKVEPTGPTKSELKAAKKRDIERKKRIKAGEAASGDEDEVFDSADEDDGVPKKGKGGTDHPEGELVDDLESDDFAFGSGDDDLDDLSTMDEWSDGPEIDTGDSLDESDLGSEDDDEEGLWSTDEGEKADAGSDVAFDSNEELGGDSDASVDEDEGDAEDSFAGFDSASDMDERPVKKAKKRAASEDADDLEARYEASRPLKKAKEPKALPTKLPIIENGKVVRSGEVLEGARAAESDEEEAIEEKKPRKVQEYKSDPLGQRFGRPAVRQLLEIRNKKERIQRAKEEIADLGREAAGTGEGEGGVRRQSRTRARGRTDVDWLAAQPAQASPFTLRAEVLFLLVCTKRWREAD